MSIKHIGRQTIALQNPPSILANACCVGAKEGEGPLRNSFDQISTDSFFGETTWEKAESKLFAQTLSLALKKAELDYSAVNYVFAGDLLNQCISTAFALRDTHIPFLGLYGACSTMAESLAMAALFIDGGFADITAAVTSSHFCSAERQFRFPLDYGGQRTPTAQWTVTGSGAALLQAGGTSGPFVTHVTPGRIVDAGIKDANNMGAAMAPAAFDTIRAHLNDLALTPTDYDLILTGDLGLVGSDILKDLFRQEGMDISSVHQDCGLLIFDLEKQDVHAGGSGCGCCASVLCGHILNGMRAGRWSKILVAATGALLSTTSSQQGESIPSISCAVTIANTR